MDLTKANLDALRVGFKTNFQDGFKGVPQMRERVSTQVDATDVEERYGWMADMPSVREWVGERVVHSLSEHDYAIREKAWELTIGVKRRLVEIDKLGTQKLRFSDFGRKTAKKFEHLVFGALKAGFTTECYDGQYFFDTDHPVLDEDGVETSVANTDGGSGAPWFLMDTTQALLPIILQVGQDFRFVAKDQPNDDNVFWNDELVYGADAYANVGYGLWQTCWGSKQTLNAAAYATARSAMQSFTADGGEPLGVMPNLLVVPPSLESAARKILNSESAAGGETNEWKGTAELLVVPWLA